MTELVVRRLLIDLEPAFDRHWCGGDAFATAFFNALSMSFPVGEQFFIDAVRRGFDTLPPEQQQRYRAEVQRFIGQEATHRRLHALFNAQLERQGLVNEWAPRALARMHLFDEGVDPRHALAATAANEHFTAIFAEWLLGHPGLLDGCEERLRTLWLWHSAEEAEHKSTAFDLYRALQGNEDWRWTWFRRITLIFVNDVLRQTLLNLRHDDSVWRWRTWTGAARLLFGRDGLVRHCYKPWRDYLRPDFHPEQHASALSPRWLADNASRYTPVVPVPPQA